MGKLGAGLGELGLRRQSAWRGVGVPGGVEAALGQVVVVVVAQLLVRARRVRCRPAWRWYRVS